jgi:hypothetical protein
MTISRMQQPRQMYGLGSFVKKAVKGVTGAVKNFAKSDAGKLALLAAAGYGLGGGTFFGRTLPGISSTGGFAFGNIPTNIGGIMGLKSGKENLLGNVLKVGGYGSVLGGALAGYGGDEEDTIGGERNVEALRAKLTQAYRNLRYPEDQIPGLVENDLAEYTMGAGGYANGGRIGYGLGSLVSGSAGVFKPTSDSMSAGDAPSFEGGSGMGGMIADLIRKNPQMLSFEEAKAMNPGMFSAEVETDVVRPNTELLNYIKRIRDAAEKGIIPMDFAMDLVKQKTMEQGVDLQDLRDDIMETQRIEQAYGGRMGYAFGSPEQNAINAAGIMNLPLNQNPAGVTELDLRETGGFIPPVGVKEKADDIPAMLSNNEFVFTADAVKGMGDGDVNKGAQRMYDIMKKLENGGRV